MGKDEISVNSEDIADKLPYELKARLDGDPFLENVAVIVAVKGNILSQYQQSQAVISEQGGKRGVAIIIPQIESDDIYIGVPGSPMRLFPSVEIWEDVELNNDDSGTGQSARRIARHIVKNLKLLNIRGIVQNLRCAVPAISPGFFKGQPPGLVIETVNLICEEISDEQLNYCAIPIFAPVPGQPEVAITCATPGAQIWYTTDDSPPYPGTKDDGYESSTATLYSGPLNITLNTPLIVRACAYRNDAGYIASSIERFTITMTG